MTTAAQEQSLSDSYMRAKKKQDKTHPHLVNVKDGRLMPNTPKLREMADYRVYDGPIDSTREQRLAWVKKAIGRNPVKIVNTQVEESFDIGKASKDDLVTFAYEQWGQTLDIAKPLKVLRDEVSKLAGVGEESLT
jgi:hypothetical protein